MIAFRSFRLCSSFPLHAFCVMLALGLSAVGTGAEGLTLRDVRVPAERPPASYTANQYVDSRGCAYIRAGVDGLVTWVPRVTRKREPICNLVPTMRPKEEIAQSVPRPHVAAAAQPEPLVEVPPTAKPAPPAKRVSQAAQTPAVRSVPTRTRAVGTRAPERRAQQAEQRASRVLPEHLAGSRASAPTFKVPRGYRAAWSDDRLNVHRAEGSRAGWQRMHLIWTDTLPRRLIDQASGQDMTARLPLVYPYTDVDAQTEALGLVTLTTMDGKVTKRVVRRAMRAVQSGPDAR